MHKKKEEKMLMMYTIQTIRHLSRAKYSCVKSGPMKKRSYEPACADPFAMLSRPHVLLSRVLLSLELLSRRFRGGLSHSMQAFASFRGERFGFRGDSIGHPTVLLCIVRVYGAHLMPIAFRVDDTGMSKCQRGYG